MEAERNGGQWGVLDGARPNLTSPAWGSLGHPRGAVRRTFTDQEERLSPIPVRARLGLGMKFKVQKQPTWEEGLRE